MKKTKVYHPSKYVTSSVAAEHLGCSRAHVASLAREPGSPFISVGGPIGTRGAKLRVELEKLNTWLQERSHKS